MHETYISLMPPIEKGTPAKFASAACDYPPAASDYSKRLFTILKAHAPNEKGTPTKEVPFVLPFGTSLAGAPQGRIQRKGLLTRSA